MPAKKGKKGKGGDDEEAPTENLLVQYKKQCKELEVGTSPSLINKINDAIDEGEELQEILINDKIGEFGARALSNALIRSTKGNKGFPTLKALRIWEGDISDEGTRAIQQFIVNTNNTSLSLIELLNCNIGPLGCEFISRCFEPSLPCKIQFLTLDYNEFGNEGLNRLMTYIKTSSSLTYLSLAYCGIDENGVQYLEDFIKTTAVLETLILMGNPLKDNGAKQLFSFIRSSNNGTLGELNLNNISFGIDSSTIDELIALFDKESLYIYQLKFNLITEENFLKITEQLATHKAIYQCLMDEERYKKESFELYFNAMKKRSKPKKKKGKKKKDKKKK